MVIGIRKMSLIHDNGNLMLFEETDIYITGVTFVVVMVFDLFSFSFFSPGQKVLGQIY